MAGLAALSLFACRQPSGESPVPEPTALASHVAARLPAVEPALDREGLLLAGIRAASAAASGEDDQESQRRLEGRRFDLRLRFGCPGDASAQAGTRQATFDRGRRAIRFRITPDITAAAPLLASLGFGDMEAAKGFWIRRPWLLVPACPAVPPPDAAATSLSPDGPHDDASPPPASATAAAPRLGIVQTFTASDARTHFNDKRFYEATIVLKAGAEPSAKGYDLVLSGRLQRMSAGKVIVCRDEGPHAPPACLVSAVFDQITLIRADTGEVLSQWAGA